MHRSHSHGDVGRFDEWASTYEGHWMQRLIFDPIQSTLLNLAASQVPQPRSILDVGCGTGRLLRTASQRFSAARLEGVDVAPQMVEQATRLMPVSAPIHFQQATAEALPFADGQFDLVFSTMTFHHWADQKKGVTPGQLHRRSGPGGRGGAPVAMAGQKRTSPRDQEDGAGDGNRTHVTSLEGWRTAIVLRPLCSAGWPKPAFRPRRRSRYRCPDQCGAPVGGSMRPELARPAKFSR